MVSAKDFAGRLVGLVLAVLVLRHVEVVLADIVDAVVAQRLALAVLQSVARQHHHGAVHAGHDVPGDHAFRRAVIDERAGAGGLPAQHHLFAGIDVGQRAAAESTGRRMQVDVVRHRVGVGIDQRHLDVVAFMHHHHRSRHRAVERHRLELGAGVVDDDFLFLDRQFELDDLRAFLGGLLVRMHEGRRHQFDGLARQLEVVVRQGGSCGEEGGDGGAYQCGSAGDHDTLLLVPAFEFDVTLLP